MFWRLALDSLGGNDSNFHHSSATIVAVIRTAVVTVIRTTIGAFIVIAVVTTRCSYTRNLGTIYGSICSSNCGRMCISN